MQKTRVEVYLFGGMSVKIGDFVVFGNDDRLKMHWKLLAFMLLYKNKQLTNQMMIDMFYDKKQIENPHSALKNTVYYLRKDMGSSNNFIGVSEGEYCWNPDTDLYLDTSEFDCLMAAIQKSKSIEKKLALYKRVLEVYSGDLLSQVDDEPWVMELSASYKQNYLDMMQNYLELLMAQEDYTQVLSVSDIVTSIEPLEERIYIYMFRALALCNMNGIISDTYLKTSRMFIDELGVDLCGEIREIYQEATRKINIIEKDITIIKEDLKEVTKEQVPIRGAYLCGYDTFKEVYQLMARTADRERREIVIILLTLVNSLDMGVPSDRVLKNAMVLLQDEVKECLRKSDTLAKYSKSQYILMLAVDEFMNADMVIDRIENRFGDYMQRNGLKMIAKASLQDNIVY